MAKNRQIEISKKVEQRRKQLFELLVKENRYLTIKDLSSLSNFNVKTISNDLSFLMDEEKVVKYKDDSSHPPRLFFTAKQVNKLGAKGKSQNDNSKIKSAPKKTQAKPENEVLKKTNKAKKSQVKLPEKGPMKSQQATKKTPNQSQGSPGKLKKNSEGKPKTLKLEPSATAIESLPLKVKAPAGQLERQVLKLLGEHGERNMEQIFETTKKSLSHISKVLTKLLEEGKVSRVKSGRKFVYHLALPLPTPPVDIVQPVQSLDSLVQDKPVKDIVNAVLDRLLEAERRIWELEAQRK